MNKKATTIRTNFGIPYEKLSFTSGTTLSNLDGRLWDEIGHKTGRFFGEEAMIRARLAIEARYLIALSDYSVIRKLSKYERKNLSVLHTSLGKKEFARLKVIETVIRHDLFALCKLLKELMQKRGIAKDIAKNDWVHWGLTTEDVDNLAKACLLKEFLEKEYFQEAKTMLLNISEFAKNTSKLVIPGKTHFQTAVPTTLGKEMALFGYRLAEQFEILKNLPIRGKLTGATGTLAAHKTALPDINWRKFSKEFVESLGLDANLYTTQIETRSGFTRILNSIHLINTVLLDLSQDMRIYAGLGWLNQKLIKKESGSSTMPQKINPIDFENAYGNANLSNWLLEGFIRQLPISWLQRDLTDKTMLRNLGLPFGHSLLALLSSSKGIKRISANKDVIKSDLESDWSIISEGLQIYLRSIGKSDVYSKLKKLSRGKKLERKDILSWIDNLEIDNLNKAELKNITPHNYTGYAKENTDEMLTNIIKTAKNLVK